MTDEAKEILSAINVLKRWLLIAAFFAAVLVTALIVNYKGLSDDVKVLQLQVQRYHPANNP